MLVVSRVSGSEIFNYKEDKKTSRSPSNPHRTQTFKNERSSRVQILCEWQGDH